VNAPATEGVAAEALDDERDERRGDPYPKQRSPARGKGNLQRGSQENEDAPSLPRNYHNFTVELHELAVSWYRCDGEARVRKLSERQQQVYDLRHSTDPPMSFDEISSHVEMEAGNVRRAYKIAAEKLENPLKPNAAKQPHMSKRIESKEPEKAAVFIEELSDPRMKNLTKAMDECNMPAKAGRSLAKRVQREYQPVLRELQKVKTDNLVREFENLSVRALQAITDGKLDKMNAYQLALIGAIAADKRELLDGRPTERISHEDRQKLPEIIEVLMSEANRRGLVKTVNPETGHAGLTQAEGVPVMVKAGRVGVEDVEILDDLTGH